MEKARFRIVWVWEELMDGKSVFVGSKLEPLNIKAELQVHDHFWQVNGFKDGKWNG